MRSGSRDPVLCCAVLYCTGQYSTEQEVGRLRSPFVASEAQGQRGEGGWGSRTGDGPFFLCGVVLRMDVGCVGIGGRG